MGKKKNKSKRQIELSKDKIHVELLMKMFDVYHDKIREDRGIPVMGVLFEENKKTLACEPSANDKRGTRKDKYKTHPEYKMVKQIMKDRKGESFDIFMTLSPCDKCYKFIKKSKTINKVFYVIRNNWSDESKIDIDNSKDVKYKQIYPVSNHPVSKKTEWYKKAKDDNIIHEFTLYMNEIFTLQKKPFKLVYDIKSITARSKKIHLDID